MNEMKDNDKCDSEELIYHISSAIERFNNARKNILEIYKRKLTPSKMIEKPCIDFNIHISKRTAIKEFQTFQNYIENFNQLYIKYGEFISKYFESDLISLYNYVEVILNGFHEISSNGSDVNIVNFEKLSLIQSAIEFVVKEFELLLKDSSQKYYMEIEKTLAEKQMQQEIKRIEYESELDPNYKNNIRKFVNNICSQITSDNPAHTLGRLHDFINLLNKADVPLVGTDGVINLNQHPRATEIFWEFLRGAVIVQTETQFIMNIKTAIVFSSLLAAILGQFPMQLAAMLASLEAKFSHLLKAIDVDDEDEIDEEEQLNNLIGLARFVAGISVAHPPPGFPVHPELGPAFLWKLMARICNEQIVSPFTAQAFIGLLEVGGHSLLHAYGNQFEKLLTALLAKFNESTNLTATSLKLLIKSALDNRSFEHIGYLTDEFWTGEN